MINFEEIAAAIMAMITGFIDTDLVDVKLEPEVDSEYSRPIDDATTSTDRAQIFVFLHSVEYDSNRSTRYAEHDENQTWQVIIRSRRLTGVNGIYDLQNKVKAALLGKRPDGAINQIELKKIMPQGKQDGVHDWSILLSLRGQIQVADLDSDFDDLPIGANLKETILN